MTKRNTVTLPAPAAMTDIYRELGDLTFRGNSADALTLVERELAFRPDRLTRRALELTFTELGQVERYHHNPHIAPSRRGSVMQHCLMTTAVVALISSTAGTTENAHSWQRRMMQTLLHDNGELLLEFSTLAGRAANGQREEGVDKTAVERRIAEYSLRMALEDACHIRSPLAQERSYSGRIRRLRAAVHDNPDGHSLLLQAGRVMQAEIRSTGFSTSPAVTNRVDRLMRIYDEVEELSPFASAGGHLVKAAENIQSNLHFLEHAGQDGATPLHEATSGFSRAFMNYSERKLPALFTAVAAPRSELSLSQARTAGALGYEVNYRYALHMHSDLQRLPADRPTGRPRPLLPRTGWTAASVLRRSPTCMPPP